MRNVKVMLVWLAVFPALGVTQYMSGPVGMPYETLVNEFKNPVAKNHLWCYWYWINDDISKEGISRDLAAMKEVGIGTAFIGNINPAEQDGKVPLFSDLWWDCMVHAVNEGKRLGVDIGVFNCPGWSQSGGPWVRPEMAMRYLVYSQVTVEGPGTISRELANPAEEFQDVCVLAFPAFENLKTLNRENTVIQTTPAVKNAQNWIDGDPATEALIDPANASEFSLTFEAKTPITARSIILYPVNRNLKTECRLYADVDGKEMLLKAFVYDRSKHDVNVGPIPTGPVAIGLPETKASRFRLVCSHIEGRNSGFTEIEITERAVLEKYIEKQLGKMHPTPLPMWGSYLWEEQPAVAGNQGVPAEKVMDISTKMDRQGRLNWQAPEGKWTIMRIGMTPTGTKNAPAAPQGKGYEIDKASAALAGYHFKQYVGKLLDKIPAENRSALKYVIADSYEMGSQNWTDGFEKRFEERYGYNPKPWLPVLSGQIVGSVTESNRFLWDLRRAIADDVAYEYVGGLRRICGQHNLQVWLENYGHWGFPSEFLMYGGQSDLVSGEFWNEGTLGDIECKAASSCVHTYGKTICFAEAFTSANQVYLRHPARLKTRGDWSFTEGVNQFVLHLYIQQPDEARVPGINAWFATEFNRHNTWFKQSKHWMDYVRRCQHLLQQGSYAADVCYFISENAPKMTGVRQPELPQGYSYDYINAEVIVRDMQVRDGRLVLPGGAAYRLMVLPPLDTMRPAVIQKLEQLIRQGGAVYGPRPVQSPSLQNYPQCDRQVQDVASRIWGADYSTGKLSRPYGKGHIFNGMELQTVLDELGVARDVDLPDMPVLWTHRTMPGRDIYFLTNQSDKRIEIRPVFRVSGLKPQAWNTLTGEIRWLSDYSQTQQGTTVPMALEPGQSRFIVFTNESASAVSPAYAGNDPRLNAWKTIDGPWAVEFKNPVIGVDEKLTLDALMDWSKSEKDSIKYYSGTAVYSVEFDLGSVPQDKDIYIDLGQVHVMAQVSVNGKPAGGVWMAPYVLPVTHLVQPGRNVLQVETVNLWRNYLVKECILPQAQRKTWLLVSDIKEGEALQPSGLVGPVVLKTVARD